MTNENDLLNSEGDEMDASRAVQNQSSRRQLIKAAVASVPMVLTLAAGTVRANGRGPGFGQGQGHGFGQGQGHGFGQGHGPGQAFGFGDDGDNLLGGDDDDQESVPYY